MAVHCGINGLVYLSAAEMDKANAWSLDIAQDASEYVVFGDSWKSQCVGAASWSGTISAYSENDQKTIQDCVVAGAAVAVLLYPLRSDLTDYYSGNVVVTGFSTNVDAGGAPVSADATFVGDSTLTVTGFS